MLVNLVTWQVVLPCFIGDWEETIRILILHMRCLTINMSVSIDIQIDHVERHLELWVGALGGRLGFGDISGLGRSETTLERD